MANTLFDTLDGLYRGLSDWMLTSRALTDLETVDDDVTFVTEDLSLATVIRIRGTRGLIDMEDFNNQVDAIDMQLKSAMSHPGHSIALFYSFDPTQHAATDACIDGLRKTAKQIGLNMDDVMEDWSNALIRHTHDEDVIMVVYSRTNSEPLSARKQMASDVAKAKFQNIRPAPMTQTVEAVATQMRNGHKTFVSEILSTLNNTRCKLIAEVIPCVEVLREARKALYPTATGDQWRPLLPGDRVALRMTDDGASTNPTSILWPALHAQIFKSDIVNVDNHTILIDGQYARAIAIDLPPQRPTAFNALFGRLNNVDFKWRFAAHIDSDGLGLLGWKGFLSSIFFWQSSNNRKIERAKEGLKHLVETGGEVDVRLRIMASVFCPDKISVDRAAATVAAAIQGWGSCDTDFPVGTMVAPSVACTIPGLSGKNPANNCAAPMSEALIMMPWTRPATIWDNGMPFRSSDGKMLPYAQMSSKQTSFNDIGVGPMGFAKSVSLNTLNLAFLLNPGLSRLPWLSILDIGTSSEGLILLIKGALPPDQKHLAVYARLRMDPTRYAINPFDLPLGCEFPLKSRIFFLIGLFSLLNTPLDKTSPPDKVVGIATAVIDMAYKEFSEDQHPKLYQKNQDIRNADLVLLDEMVEKLGIHVDRHTSWHAIRDAFFDRGFIKEAGIAHRQAMPTLKEVAAFANTEAVKDIYGEEACQDFWRNCMEAESLYPIITVPTRFTLGEAQIVSLDIDEVAPKGSAVADRQTAVMYMVASDVLTSRFFVMPADVNEMPQRYRAYHEERIERIRQDPKRIVFDEFHRVGKNSTVAEKVVRDLETASREARKWNLSIGLYSQDPGDFPAVLAGFATTVFLFGVGTRTVARKAAEIFGLSESDVNVCVRHLRKPNASGATIFAKFSTSEGDMTQFLVNTLGSRILWALATTTEDSYVRSKLYRILGDGAARSILADLYPGGSIKELYEKLRLTMINEDPLPEDYEVALQQLRNTAKDARAIDARDVIVQHVLNVHRSTSAARIRREKLPSNI